MILARQPFFQVLLSRYTQDGPRDMFVSLQLTRRNLSCFLVIWPLLAAPQKRCSMHVCFFSDRWLVPPASHIVLQVLVEMSRQLRNGTYGDRLAVAIREMFRHQHAMYLSSKQRKRGTPHRSRDHLASGIPVLRPTADCIRKVKRVVGQ